MANKIQIGRYFFAAAIAGIGVRQVFYADFCPFIFPDWPDANVFYDLTAIASGIILITAAVLLASQKYAGDAALVLGVSLLLCFLFGQLPYEFFVIPYKKTHLGLWINPLKETALAGGSLILAGEYTFSGENQIVKFFKPLGVFLFCFMIGSFGISHFLYPQTIEGFIPTWVPDHPFWTYFTGVALISAAAALVLGIRARLIALLLAVMILLWIIVLHIPAAVDKPLADHGREVNAALSALAFSGIAFMISGSSRPPAEGIEHLS